MNKMYGWNSSSEKMEYAKNCKGKAMLTEKCREALYDWLDEKNWEEWKIALSYWWYGIPWLAVFGTFDWFTFPLKMLLFLVAPGANPPR